MGRIVVVEAKRGSGKSGHGERDQLARQVDNAVALAGKGVLVGVVYITADVAYPKADLDASRQELEKDGHCDMPLWWASWRDVRPLLDRAASGSSTNPTLVSICKDTSACLIRWGLGGFAGIQGIEVRSAPPLQLRERNMNDHATVDGPAIWAAMKSVREIHRCVSALR